MNAFRDAARRARFAGFEVVEIHAAHGYLLHEFMSPLVNARADAYGGAFDHRIRLCVEVVDAVRAVWPDHLPVFVRISATDWKSGGWDMEQSVELARRLIVGGDDGDGPAAGYREVTEPALVEKRDQADGDHCRVEDPVGGQDRIFGELGGH